MSERSEAANLAASSIHRVGIHGTLKPPKGKSVDHGGFHVIVVGNILHVAYADEPIDFGKESGWLSQVDGLGDFLGKAPTIQMGWGIFPDDAEVIFIYDPDQDNFGYAVNLDWPDGSEWGYAPSSTEGTPL